MANILIVISQDLMLYRLISNVRVRITRSGYTTYTYKHHYGISADLMAQKWLIGLYKENHILLSTTQDNVISSLKPLTQWYRTYYLSQSLGRLHCRFYTDTLVANHKSIVGDKCAPIFIDG